MAHELTQRADGKTEFAFTGNRSKIWHGLGSELTEGSDIETWKTESGMDWEIFRSVVSYQSMDGTHQFDDKNVLFRSDTKSPLSIVGKDYSIVQPGQVLEFFRDLTELHGYKLSAAGTLFGGTRFWATAEIGKTFSAVPEDEIKGQLLLVTSCDNSTSTQAKFVSTRTVCNNTLTVALREHSKNLVRKTHASEWNPESFKIDLGLVDESWEKFSTQMKKLTEIEVNDKFVQNYFQMKFFNPSVSVDDQTTQTYNKIKKFMNLYKNGAGSHFAPDTAYQVLQALTDGFTHGIRAKQDPSRRMWEGSFGNADRIKTLAFNELYAMAA